MLNEGVESILEKGGRGVRARGSRRVAERAVVGRGRG